MNNARKICPFCGGWFFQATHEQKYCSSICEMHGKKHAIKRAIKKCKICSRLISPEYSYSICKHCIALARNKRRESFKDYISTHDSDLNRLISIEERSSKVKQKLAESDSAARARVEAEAARKREETAFHQETIRQKQKAAVMRRPKANCLCCNRDFTITNPGRKFCSAACKDKWMLLAKRACPVKAIGLEFASLLRERDKDTAGKILRDTVPQVRLRKYGCPVWKSIVISMRREGCAAKTVSSVLGISGVQINWLSGRNWRE